MQQKQQTHKIETKKPMTLCRKQNNVTFRIYK